MSGYAVRYRVQRFFVDINYTHLERQCERVSQTRFNSMVTTSSSLAIRSLML